MNIEEMIVECYKLSNYSADKIRKLNAVALALKESVNGHKESRIE